MIRVPESMMSNVRAAAKVWAVLTPMSFVLMTACGDTSSEVDGEAGFADPASAYQGLAFSTTDRSYSASNIWFNDFATGEQRSLSTGESGDPLLAELNGKLYLFNRGMSLNFRELSLTDGPVGEQLATPGAQSGDPSAAADLGEDLALLTMSVAGKMVVANLATGALAQEVKAAFDTGTGSFHPTAIYMHKSNDAQTAFVLHQGYDVKDYVVTLNGSSQVFVFTVADGKLTPVDLDPATAKVQGIELTNDNPVAFVTSGDQPLIVGSCFAHFVGTCTATTEVLDPEARTVTNLFDLSGLGFTGNGPVVDGGDGRFFANLVKTETGDKVVARIDPVARTLDTVHTFPDDSAGCCATFQDTTTDTLYVGDAATEGDQGLFSIYRGGATSPTEAKVSSVPYSGVFLAK